jgi:toxin-antitoxin system PIN domain toxin
MKIPDVNLLVNSVNPGSAHHDTAREWLNAALSGSKTTGFAWLTVIGFVRVTSNPRAFTDPLTVGEAFDYVDGWLAQPHAEVSEPGAAHAKTVRSLLERSGAAGDLTSDAHLAAIAIHHDATLVSFDSDFERFEGLRFERLG